MKPRIEIPLQRDGAKPKRVITTYTVVLREDDSVIRHLWRGDTDEEILDSIESEPIDAQIQEFVDELQATGIDNPKLLFTRSVCIVDPN